MNRGAIKRVRLRGLREGTRDREAQTLTARLYRIAKMCKRLTGVKDFVDGESWLSTRDRPLPDQARQSGRR